jgi:hypothetical protein
MPKSPDSLETLLAQLEEAKTRFGPEDGGRAEELLAALAGQRFADAASLARFHEAVLFLRAYPQSPAVLRLADEILESFAQRVEQLRSAGADLGGLEEPDVSGIAGTGFSAVFSYPAVCLLAQRHAAEVSIDWEGHSKPERLGSTLPRFVPLLEDDALVEANLPARAWLGAAAGGAGHELAWLLERLERLPLSLDEIGELYDSLELPIRWELGNSTITRSRLRIQVPEIFYHEAPLRRRSEVSLEAELKAEPLPLRRVSRTEGRALVELAQDTSAMRYRELYGFTYGDPARMLKAAAGRGVEILVWGVPPERRLPLRAYHAGLFFKNGTPIGYVEGLSLFERMEVGFNIYYTFREGESAWLYAQTLRLFHQVLGVTCFSVDPYQIGHHNQEAIQAGAFWFYRKLGFRPLEAALARLVEHEERKMRSTPGYRTPARTLRRLAEGSMIFEGPGASPGDWDRFQVRNLGFAVGRRMAERFAGDAGRMRRASLSDVGHALGIGPARWKEAERRAFENLSLVLGLIPDLAQWTETEKRALFEVIRAKAGGHESLYLWWQQQQPRLRAAVLKLGSR